MLDNNDSDLQQDFRLSSEELAAEIGLPMSIAQPALVGYRSVGIGTFGAIMRWAGMPLEKIALYMNSSQVSGKGQFAQAVKLTFAEGALAPYKVVGPASLMAWFMQYSVMGVAFQFFDQTLSNLMGVRPMYYGKELMEPPEKEDNAEFGQSSSSFGYRARGAIKTILSPVCAACLESYVSNRAEVQRFFGPQTFAQIETTLAESPWKRAAGPAFAANSGRNVIMCQTSFLLTPLAYKLYFPQDQKSKTTLFWFGLSLNIFVGNVIAITQQALWGRSLDYLKQNGRIHYRSVIQQGYQKEGLAAFFTIPKWCSRVLMNAPAQGTLPWFYNEVLPLGEPAFMGFLKSFVYGPFLKGTRIADTSTATFTERCETTAGDGEGRPCNLQRQRSHYATLPTANPEFEIAERERRRR
jgi:hypothetical protein